MKRYEIPLDLLNATLEYLAGRPWKEVAPLMDALRQLEEVPEAKDEEG